MIHVHSGLREKNLWDILVNLKNFNTNLEIAPLNVCVCVCVCERERDSVCVRVRVFACKLILHCSLGSSSVEWR